MQSVRSVTDGVWAGMYPDLTRTIQLIFNTSPYTFNGSLPLTDILKCATAIRRSSQVSPPLILAPEGFDHIRMWGHLRDKTRVDRFPSIASRASPIRTSLALAYQRQYNISIVSWPRNRFVYYNYMTVDNEDDSKSFTIRSGQFVYHHEYGFGHVVCFMTQERAYTRPFIVLAPLTRSTSTGTDRLVSLTTYQEEKTLIVAGIPGLQRQRYYFVDSTHLPGDTSTRRNRVSPPASKSSAEADTESSTAFFGFRQNYYRTRANEGVAGTIYWHVDWPMESI